MPIVFENIYKNNWLIKGYLIINNIYKINQNIIFFDVQIFLFNYKTLNW